MPDTTERGGGRRSDVHHLRDWLHHAIHEYNGMAAALDVSGAMAAGAADGSADQGVYQAGPADQCRTRYSPHLDPRLLS